MRRKNQIINDSLIIESTLVVDDALLIERKSKLQWLINIVEKTVAYTIKLKKRMESLFPFLKNSEVDSFG